MTPPYLTASPTATVAISPDPVANARQWAHALEPTDGRTVPGVRAMQLALAVDALRRFEASGYLDYSQAAADALAKVSADSPAFATAIAQSREALRRDCAVAAVDPTTGEVQSITTRVTLLSTTLLKAADYLTAVRASGATPTVVAMAQVCYVDLLERSQMATAVAMARAGGHDDTAIVHAVVAHAGYDSGVPRPMRALDRLLGVSPRSRVTSEERTAAAALFTTPLLAINAQLRGTWDAAEVAPLSTAQQAALAGHLDRESSWRGWPVGDARARIAVATALQGSLRTLAASRGGPAGADAHADAVARRPDGGVLLAAFADRLHAEQGAVARTWQDRDAERQYPGGSAAYYAALPAEVRALQLRAAQCADLAGAATPPSWLYARIATWAQAGNLDADGAAYCRALVRGTAREVSLERVHEATGDDAVSVAVARAQTSARLAPSVTAETMTPAEAAQMADRGTPPDDVDVSVLVERALAEAVALQAQGVLRSGDDVQAYRASATLGLRQRLLRAELAQLDAAELLGAAPDPLGSVALVYGRTAALPAPDLREARTSHGTAVRDSDALAATFLGGATLQATPLAAPPLTGAAPHVMPDAAVDRPSRRAGRATRGRTPPPAR